MDFPVYELRSDNPGAYFSTARLHTKSQFSNFFVTRIFAGCVDPSGPQGSYINPHLVASSETEKLQT